MARFVLLTYMNHFSEISYDTYPHPGLDKNNTIGYELASTLNGSSKPDDPV
ncbi:hypothetical protein CCACVL1_18698 [Corchorus capsularis]|uniref:Uncharacterized protein n=1 Tax=Corchorus capsularis TaxID=210143 RepID=A0A1R3HJX7_COCAP|nr:hypothetical protein CCACVL1_18698 [Corchorus capsularis]